MGSSVICQCIWTNKYIRVNSGYLHLFCLYHKQLSFLICDDNIQSLFESFDLYGTLLLALIILLFPPISVSGILVSPLC
jgi:hypothetical protein